MRFKNYITESMDVDAKKRWDKYIKTDPMIGNGVKILKKIASHGYDAYIVGGAVRDIIMGIKPHDIDISTNMPIEELNKIFKTYDIGKSKDFGIVVVNMGGFQYEIAQFRAESDYNDNRRPDKVEFIKDFKTDAARRDLTINAMAIDADGNIIDHFDGKKAIFDKVIKTVGNPYDRFEEDKLRMMRACRFSAKYCFKLDPETKNAIKDNASDISKISIERVKDELVKMASNSGDRFADAILILDEVGILDIILPEITKLKTTKETKKHHPEAYEHGNGTVFDHVISALRQNKLEDPLINLAILFHDVGKGVTYAKKTKNGETLHTYYGHDNAGVDLIKTIAKRLKLTNKERDAIIYATINHMKLFKSGNMKPSKIMKIVNDENWELLKQVSYCDDSCRIGMFSKSDFDKTIANMEEITKKWGDVLKKKSIKIIDGNRVMKLTGLKPGKEVGDVIKKATDYILNNGIKDDKEYDTIIMKAYNGEL